MRLYDTLQPHTINVTDPITINAIPDPAIPHTAALSSRGVVCVALEEVEERETGGKPDSTAGAAEEEEEEEGAE
jgi:hypothetical protein